MTTSNEARNLTINQAGKFAEHHWGLPASAIIAARLPAADQAAAPANSYFAEALDSLPAADQAAVLARALAAAITNYDFSRARELGSLAARLPADLMSQVLAAAAAPANDFSRAQALAILAAHLPAGLLADALAAAPKRVADPLAALLIRGRSILLPDKADEWLGLLRNAVNGTDRAICLRVISAVAPTIAEIGGATAVRECVNAIEDAHRWWP